MSATEPLQHRGAAISLMQMMQTERRQGQEHLQAQSSEVDGHGPSSSHNRVESASGSPRTPIPRNDSSSTVGGGSAASSPGQTAAVEATAAADEPLEAPPSADIAMQPAVELVHGSESQLEEGELISGSARLSGPQPEAESATASSLTMAGRQSSRLNSCADTNMLSPPATTVIVTTSNLSPPDTLLVPPVDAATAMDDESADEESSTAAAAAPAPATDLMRDSSDDSCVSVPAPASRQLNCWSSREPAHRFQSHQPSSSPPAGLFPCFDSSAVPTALSSASVFATNQLLDQLGAWLAALVGSQSVSSPPSQERAPSELAELLSKLTVARQRTGKLALESGEASAPDSSRTGSCEVPSEEEKLQWLDELIAAVKRIVHAEAASEAETQRPRPYEPVSPRVEAPLLLAPEDESTAVWRLEQQYSSNVTLQDFVSAASPRSALASPASDSSWHSLPELPDHDSHLFGSPPPSSTPATQPRAPSIRPWLESRCHARHAQTQTFITGSLQLMGQWREEWRNIVSGAATTVAATSAPEAAPVSPPPTGLACTRSLRSKQSAVAAAAAVVPTSSSGQIALAAAHSSQQVSAAAHCRDAQPVRVIAAAASKATKTDKARPTRSQSGAATLPPPPARETSGSKRGRPEPSESLHAQITLNGQLMGATTAADPKSATIATESAPVESELASAPAAKRRKSIPTAAQQATPAAPRNLVASVDPKKKVAEKATKSIIKANARAPTSPTKAAATKPRAANDQDNALADSELWIHAAEPCDLKHPTPARAEAAKTPVVKTESKALPPPIAPSPTKSKGRKNLLPVGVAKRSKDATSKSLSAAASKEDMQVDSCAAAVVAEEPAAEAHASSLPASNAPKPSKREQERARLAGIADNAKKLWHIVRDRNVPNTVSHAELRELMGWSPQKVKSAMQNILHHWATDGVGPPTHKWKVYRPAPNAAAPKAAAPKNKSDAAPFAAPTAELVKSGGGKGENKFELLCSELGSSADEAAVATLQRSLQPELLLAAVRAELALENAGSKAGAESAQLSEAMSDAGSASQSASPLQGSSQSIISSPMLLTTSSMQHKSDATPALPDADAGADVDVHMQALEEDRMLHAPDSSSPTPTSSTHPLYVAMHTRVDKKHLSN